MSYTIVYNRQFVKIDGKIIPLVLYGSNNCYEATWRGRGRREREWHPMYLGSNTMIALTEDEIMGCIHSYCDGEYQEHFMRNGKWVDDAGLIRFFKNGIKNAKTIEEMKSFYFFNGMRGYFSVWNGSCNEINKIENDVEISSSDDLRRFLESAKCRLENRANGEAIYICLKFYDENFESRIKIATQPKERMSSYWAIKVNNSGYLVQVTSKRIKYYALCDKTKQFETEVAANKYIEKLKEKFSCSLSAEYIADKKLVK